ncbi:hypothetical protein QYS36_19060 [Pseudomonas sp. G34]|uniref:hypothetical protein n=1 Tax=Pseudomonas sp. G34 TaxID=3059083 RepID=UPI002807B3F9|nr:hypothetical protein [Pseudomonas sp. G34]MDQ7987044.1 hypothetical protein [Pseudomonas sp. G34]
MSYEFLLSMVAVLAAGAWHYGSSGPDKRENFRRWLSEHTRRAKPVIASSAIRLLFLCLLAGAAVIAWSAAKEIYEFRVSSEPITRRDVFRLILNTFNAIAYAGASVAFLLLAIAPLPKQRLPLILTEGKPVRIRLQGSTDAEALKKALHEGITVTVSIDSKRHVHIEADNLDGISLSQLPATPSSSTTIKD